MSSFDRVRWSPLVALVFLLAVGGSASSAAPAAPAVAGSDTAASIGERFVPGVVGAFNGLSQRADALVFARNGTPEADTCRHYQGLARKDGPDGTPYLILTKSGNIPFFGCGITVTPGYLIVARMGSREKTGERLRTNFLPYDTPLADLATLADDKGITYIPFDGASGVPAYRHPGGVQILGDILAVGAENPFGTETHRANILFFNIHDPEHPVLRSRFIPPDLGGEANEEFGTDPVGLTAVKTADGECCRYLLVAAGGPANKEVRFYLSKPDAGGTTTDLNSTSLGWDQVGRYSESQIESCLGADWPSGLGTQHQMLNFVREGSLDGDLYLVGGLRDGSLANPFADERLDLYKVHLGAGGSPQSCPLTHVKSKVMYSASWGGFTDTGSFAAGSSVYVSPSGELIVYDSNHGGSAGDTVVLGEYRIGSLVRANSPTLKPTAKIDGSFAVDEGSSVALTGSGEPPITKAFIQLFEDTNVGLEGTVGAWLTVEYDTRDADSFDQLDFLHLPASSIWEATSSWRWFAPPGCTISANDYPVRSSSFPGPDTVQLRGTGRFEEALDLSHLPVYTPPGAPYPVAPVPSGETATIKNYIDDIEGVTFYEAYRDGNDALIRDHVCERYYNAPFSLGWDLDNNGSFEASGTSVTFDAASLVGPATPTVQARAKHSTDTSAVGTGAAVTVPVEVRNGAPQVSAAAVTDPLGYDLNGGTRVSLPGLPVQVLVTFTDPGRPDTQTAAIDWGDGTSADTSFASFSDARNGATGRLQDARVYTQPGTYTITATITDDDGGATPVTFTVRVVSLQDAVQGVADELTQLIAAASDPAVASALRAARDELIGNLGGRPPTNGALDKLDANDPVGAITKLRAALSDLITAEARGAGDLSALKDLLG